jgi:methyltransferase
MVALHIAVITLTLLRGDRRARRGWLLLLLACQPLRVWVQLTLSTSWNTRGAVPRDLQVETSGPYKLLRHPNYLVVVLELLALPLAFGLRSLAAVTTAINVVLLAVRIRDEERALMRLPAYRSHFKNKARFIPGVF